AGEEKAEADKKTKPGTGGVLEHFRDALKGKVADVRASNRLTGSPACLGQPDGALPPPLRRVVQAPKRRLPRARRLPARHLRSPAHSKRASLGRARAELTASQRMVRAPLRSGAARRGQPDRRSRRLRQEADSFAHRSGAARARLKPGIAWNC